MRKSIHLLDVAWFDVVRRRAWLPLAIVAVVLVGWENSASAQVVQLPVVQQFRVSTTVSVPDRGGIVLGGVGRSSQSSISRGVPGASKIPGAGRLFSNRGIGGEAGASTASAHVWIHNFDELDAIHRSAARPTSAAAEIERKAAYLSKNVARRK